MRLSLEHAGLLMVMAFMKDQDIQGIPNGLRIEAVLANDGISWARCLTHVLENGLAVKLNDRPVQVRKPLGSKAGLPMPKGNSTNYQLTDDGRRVVKENDLDVVFALMSSPG